MSMEPAYGDNRAEAQTEIGDEPTSSAHLQIALEPIAAKAGFNVRARNEGYLFGFLVITAGPGLIAFAGVASTAFITISTLQIVTGFILIRTSRKTT